MSTTKKPRMSRRHFLFTMAGAAAAGVVAPRIAAPAAPKKTKILWWSHWAEEVNKRNLLIDVAKAFMAKHPDVEIEQVWWDKTAMFPTMRNAFTLAVMGTIAGSVTGPATAAHSSPFSVPSMVTVPAKVPPICTVFSR